MSDLLVLHQERFEGFVAPYVRGEPADQERIVLKREHSARVLDNARRIVELEITEPDLAGATLLAALYHDLGRFPQYATYATFRDADSENHAALGARWLKRLGLLQDLDPALRRVVMGAVILHNRFALPPAIPENVRQAARVVRDADKLDIMHVMLEHLASRERADPVVVLSVEDAPEKHSHVVLRAVLEGRPGSYLDLRYVNDFVILMCGWCQALEFPSSTDMLRQRGLLDHMLELLPHNEAMDGLRRHMRPLTRAGRGE